MAATTEIVFPEYTQTTGTNYVTRKYKNGGFIEVFSYGTVVDEFNFNQIGNSNIYWSYITNINLVEHFSVLYSIAFNVRNTGTIWCGNFKLNSNGNGMDGMVFQYGNGQRTTTFNMHVFGK